MNISREERRLANFVRSTLSRYAEKNQLSQAEIAGIIARESGGTVARGTVQALINPSRNQGDEKQYNPSARMLRHVAQAYYELAGGESFKRRYNELAKAAFLLP